jgi:hypothetical protein
MVIENRVYNQPKKIQKSAIRFNKSRNNRLGLTAKNVPGRNRIPRKEIVFIAELSRLVASAMLLESAATARVNLLSRWLIRLYT